MKTKIMLVLAGALGLFGCTSMGPDQIIAQQGEGAGSAIGSYLLRKHSTAGVVDPAYLADYKAFAPKLAAVMQGAVTPADVHTLIADANGVTLTTGQTTVVGYLVGITPQFVKVNGGTVLTRSGALTQAAAEQVAAGLEDAVGLITGTNYVPPSALYNGPPANPNGFVEAYVFKR